MKKVNIVIEQTPLVQEFEIYNDYIEFHDSISPRPYTFQHSFKNFSKRKIGEEEYINIYSCFNRKILTLEAYKKMLEESKITYQLCERDLIRCQYNSNTRFTGDQNTMQDVINYMRDENKSWLPQIYKEINEEIKGLQEKIKKLEEVKIVLQDDDYLIKHITKHIEISKGE